MFSDVIFNDDTLNIFVDASIKKYEEETIGCPGAIAIYKGEVIDKDIRIIRNSTNNNSEITAIYLGVQLVNKYKHKFKNFNIFSDSKICVFGLREWIFNWISKLEKESDNPEDYTEDYKPYELYGSTNSPVFNQSEIMLTIQTIINNNVPISIYHQRGHVSVDNIISLQNAMEVFCKNNNINPLDICMDTIIELSNYNDMVDNETRRMFDTYEYIKETPRKQAVYFSFNRCIDMNRYSKLLNLSSLK